MLVHLNPYCTNMAMVLSSTLTDISHQIKQHNHNEIHKTFYGNAETQTLSLLKGLQIKKKRISIVRNLRILSLELIMHNTNDVYSHTSLHFRDHLCETGFSKCHLV